MKKIKKALLLVFGILNIGLGFAGVFVPGLPTTVFLLIAAWAFLRSSDRAYRWLLEHRLLGRYIRDYEKHKSMKLSTKIYAMSLMSLMIILSTYFAVYPKLGLKGVLIMAVLFIAGNVAVLLVPTRKKTSETQDLQVTEPWES